MIFGEHSAFDCRFSTACGSSYDDTASQERARASAGIAGRERRMGPKQGEAIFLADGRAIFILVLCSAILGNFTI